MNVNPNYEFKMKYKSEAIPNLSAALCSFQKSYITISNTVRSQDTSEF